MEWFVLLLHDVICSICVIMDYCQWGGKPPKIAPSPWDFVTLPDEDRATDIGNMHKKFGKDRACGSGDILLDRQTDTQTDVLFTSVRPIREFREMPIADINMRTHTITDTDIR